MTGVSKLNKFVFKPTTLFNFVRTMMCTKWKLLEMPIWLCQESLNQSKACFDTLNQSELRIGITGLPEPNGDNHVREISRMSLKILDRVRKFEIRLIQRINFLPANSRL